MSAAVGILCMGSPVAAQILYDGSFGTLPEVQGWAFLALPALATATQDGTAARLNTTASGSILAGWSRLAGVPLDRATGYSVGVQLELLSESHASTNRSGVSLIVLGADRKGIELALWTDRIWAQSELPLFTQAEGVSFGVAGGWRDLRLTVLNNGYALTVDGVPVLGGPIRDYTAFTGPFDPYETANFIFLGDDTTSARGDFRVRKVELSIPSPVPPALRAVGIRLGGIELGWDGARGLESWRLESKVSLNGEGWATVPAVRRLESGEVRVNVPMMDATGFFRLR